MAKWADVNTDAPYIKSGTEQKENASINALHSYRTTQITPIIKNLEYFLIILTQLLRTQKLQNALNVILTKLMILQRMLA